MTPCTTMQEYGVQKTGQLLDVLVVALCEGAESLDEDAVHKVRVAIRRFQQSIRIFKQYLRSGGVKRLKVQLGSVMDLAGELRNRDIAIALVGKARGDTADLETQRTECHRQLQQFLKGLATPYLAEFWRQELGLEAAG
jgi:CHAD domain-containing protein